jgi:hypothetical protein
VPLYMVYGVPLYMVYGVPLYMVYGVPLYMVYGVPLYMVYGVPLYMAIWYMVSLFLFPPALRTITEGGGINSCVCYFKVVALLSSSRA